MCRLSSEEHTNLADLELSQERKKILIDKLANYVQSRGFETAAIFTLEVVKPLSWIGLQFLLGISPLFIPLLNEQTFNEYAKLFEDRENIEAIVQRIEKVREERELQEKTKKGAQPKGTKRGFLGFRGKGSSP